MLPNSAVLLALALNIVAFFYLQAWLPIVHLVRSVRLSRQIRAYRVAGLLLLLFAVSVMPVHAQGPEAGRKHALGYQYLHSNSKPSRLIIAPVVYSDGDDALLQKFQYDVQHESDITGYLPVDNAIRYVWNNCGKLMIIFLLLAVVSMLRSKLELDQETYGDIMRREARERGDFETTASDDIHDPFNSPEGMQPASQYVPVRTRR
jgi:hypothetical protein